MTEPTLGDLSDYQAKDPQQALDAALAAVQSYCGWHISPAVTETVNVWSPDGRTVFVQTLALTSITSVVQDSVTLSSSTYTFEPYGVIKRTPGAYFSLLSKVAVTFVHGYAALPDDVKGVVLGLAQRSINDTRGLVPRAGAGSPVVITEGAGLQLSASDKDKLAPFTASAGFA